MPQAAETIVGHVANPSSTVTALTAAAGGSFAVRNFANTASAYLDQVWAHEATAGIIRIRSPRLHDQVQGIRLQVGDTNPRLLLPDNVSQLLFPSDNLTVEMTGGGSETDLGAFNVYYTDLPGIAARLANWSEIQPRIKNIVGVEVDCTTSSTAGEWSGGTALNATFDNLQANADYAVLGYNVGTACGAVAISGADTGNLKIGGPGALDGIQTREFFINQAVKTGRPYIPVINSNNRGATLAYVADPATSASVHVSFVLAELK
jgi:hypothetical protein